MSGDYALLQEAPNRGILWNWREGTSVDFDYHLAPPEGVIELKGPRRILTPRGDAICPTFEVTAEGLEVSFTDMDPTAIRLRPLTPSLTPSGIHSVTIPIPPEKMFGSSSIVSFNIEILPIVTTLKDMIIVPILIQQVEGYMDFKGLTYHFCAFVAVSWHSPLQLLHVAALDRLSEDLLEIQVEMMPLWRTWGSTRQSYDKTDQLDDREPKSILAGDHVVNLNYMSSKATVLVIPGNPVDGWRTMTRRAGFCSRSCIWLYHNAFCRSPDDERPILSIIVAKYI